jgi:Carbohydrate phosphorylase
VGGQVARHRVGVHSWWKRPFVLSLLARKAILNAGHAGTFSSDRTIADHAADVWQRKPCLVEEALTERRTMPKHASVPTERSRDRA